MSLKSLIRLLLDLAIFLSVLFGLWFVVLPLGVIAAWYYSFFLEFILAGIVYDSLFGMVRGMGAWGYVGTIVSIIFWALVIGLKKVLRR
jgi:hypothetical protein